MMGNMSGDWEELRDDFCYSFSLTERIDFLPIDSLDFEQLEESIGAAHLCRVETYSNSPCPRYWASYGVVSQLVFTLGWVVVSCFGDVSGSCAVCYGG